MPGGTSTTSSADDFTYLTVPTVTKVEPDEGPAAGSTKVTITGTGFTGAKEVKFGQVAAKSFWSSRRRRSPRNPPLGRGK